MDSVLALDPSLPKRRAVEDLIRRMIADDLWQVGSRVPAARELALEFGVARGTVVAAVDDLVADGLLVSRERAGIFVARSGEPSTVPEPILETRAPRFDLRPGRPETGSFPGAKWSAALRRTAGVGLANAPGEEPLMGSHELRVELAGYLRRARGVEANPASIVICGGYRSASTILAATFRELGLRTVAIEDPSLPEMDRLWRAAGMDVVDLPVDELGAQTELLDGTIDAATLTPAHQFPLGGALESRRRRVAVAWAERSDRFIVEDDYDGEFRFDRRPIAALQRSAPHRVIYIGSVSKTLDTRLRLGWMVLPQSLIRPVAATTARLTGGVPLIDQLALAHLIRSGDFERHVRRQRREYARRHEFLIAAAAAEHLTVPGIPAGLQALVPLGSALEADEEDRGVIRLDDFATHAVHRYVRNSDRPPAVVVGFATPSRAAFPTAVQRLFEWMRDRP
ncbi:GntR family transcriptional regulator / MocR family aminotransferase [Curtobacterium sp. 314Chir4.1]|uniref:MocR-like pyridoxine biosynthesis transcription factor PdxR n=1 Tax=Curtobacterium sp. 314Chir4.1 TaxID=1279028 RepID=UPI000BC812BF|nr:PLP-dependent aminotransferase family protein [Curtobacterium sp. 314Chir4.1]SOC89619.1 GntR family transcriptional regulator / MocR family aminotransferase [Curtobacterium sp. 314Chir4.1]